MFFNLFMEVSQINQNNYNSNWEKLLGFRNMQEKLENDIDLKLLSGKNTQKLNKQNIRDS